ncbi:MAG: DUF3035 domain-containing protein [Pseudomonadota bacterium]
MIGGGRKIGLGAAGLLVLLGACGSQNTERESLLRTAGLRQPPPDEFLVVERKPLEIPGSLTSLPLPDPEGINRVDPQPREEVTSLLSGDATLPQRSAEGPLSPGEAALLALSGEDAVEPEIRATLQSEDRDLVASGRIYGLDTFFGVPTNDPYRQEVLDPFTEVERLRAEGVQTPAAPPQPEREPGQIF